MASTAVDVFLDFLRLRTGLVEALTTDLDEFLARCDPGKLKKGTFGISRFGSLIVNLLISI
ncbi:hypothetical protein Scep_014899 [Stephania cephalantha]|uniref:Alfin N-terminal domain-containing protein n=1 Tax=Stephania cephalantha TaxID=152367 RepID=A0AAP0P0V6_9MAGN